MAKKRKMKTKSAAKKGAKKTRKAAPARAGAGSKLEDALRNWRMAEAKRRGVPAFRICSDVTLKAMAERRPSTAAELLAIPGIGMKAVESYGAAIFRLVAQTR